MPAVDQRTVRIEGLRELSRAFALADKAERKRFRDGLRDVAEPVRADAEAFATGAIKPGTIPWASMRVGITRTSVYVAPRQRSTRIQKRKRKNLAPILMDRAMSPALDAHREEIVDRTDDVLADVARLWERA